MSRSSARHQATHVPLAFGPRKQARAQSLRCSTQELRARATAPRSEVEWPGAAAGALDLARDLRCGRKVMPHVYTPTRNQSTELLIVGGGPVGLFGALCAAQRGLAVTLLDRGFRGYSRGHVTLLHPSTLRLMAELGLGSKLLAAGRSIDRVELYLDRHFSTSLDLPSSALTIAQSAFEELLLKEVQAQEIEIESPWDATSLQQTSSNVEVRTTRHELVSLGAAALAGERRPVESAAVQAQFVIGADGRESRVRTALSIEPAHAGPREKFAMFEGPRSLPRHDFALSFTDGLGAVALPLADDCGRWGFQVSEDDESAPDIDHLRSLLVERGAWEPNPPNQLHWSAVMHFERRLAREFGRGRVWLAGDAAHVTSPFGGQSVNGGLMEIHALVDAVASCLKGTEPITELERISKRHEREWEKLLGINVRMETRPGTSESVSKYAQRIVPALPASGRDLQHLLAQLGLRLY